MRTFEILFEPSTQRFFASDYVFTPQTIEGLKVGDELFHSGWMRDRSGSYDRIVKNGWQFIVKSNDPLARRIVVTRKCSPDHSLVYGYRAFGTNWLVKELRTLQYDPMQQGDTDEDI